MNRSTLIVVGILIGGAIATLWLVRDRTPPMTRSSLAEARRAWDERGLRDYTLTLRKDADGLGSETIVTEVRGGAVARLVLDGTPLEPRPTYSVPGLFDTIEQELELRDRPEQVPGAPRHAVLKGRFHESIGFPLVFKRLAPQRKSYLLAVERLEIPGTGVLYAGD